MLFHTKKVQEQYMKQTLSIKLIHDYFLRAGHYIRFIVTAGHRKGHGIHPPFAYELVSKVLFDREYKEAYDQLKNLRNTLKRNKTNLHVSSIGVNSKHFTGNTRRIGQLLKHSSIQSKYSKFFYRIAEYYRPNTIIELGTSIGVSTLSFALGNPKAKVLTIEGNSALCNFAGELFKAEGVNNITLFEGDFDEHLQIINTDYPPPDLVFIDGNHSKEATLRYFKFFVHWMEEGFLIFDDINWSAGMQEAWKDIVDDERAQITFDLFRMGIVVRRKQVTPGHYRIRF
jgi:predicted O-methyltransferase YrrM